MSDSETTEQGSFKADPSKEFFIFMLTRDVSIARSILDLVDNSVDAAHARVREGKGAYSDFLIRISASEDGFEIVDNCGGIRREDAENYAFYFGRPPGRGASPASIGQFGVGMKRTIFKLGSHFCIESVTFVDGFRVEEDVSTWMKRSEWTFPFHELDQLSVPEVPAGTVIRVTELFETVQAAFRDTEFLADLLSEIGKAHALFLSEGLRIEVGPKEAQPPIMEVLVSNLISPAVDVMSIGREPNLVKVTIIAGITNEGSRSIGDGGWYIFCNNRLIEAANQGSETGWGLKDSRKTPNYHPDFAFFRGFVFFESENSSLLPWTTTKTGIDIDSPTYVAVRKRMMEIMRPILVFLRERATEAHDNVYSGTLDRKLQDALEAAEMTPVKDLRVAKRSIFTGPKFVPAEKGRMQRIVYLKPRDEAEAVKEALGVDTWQAVGEKTFEYYHKREVD